MRAPPRWRPTNRESAPAFPVGERCQRTPDACGAEAFRSARWKVPRPAAPRDMAGAGCGWRPAHVRPAGTGRSIRGRASVAPELPRPFHPRRSPPSRPIPGPAAGILPPLRAGSSRSARPGAGAGPNCGRGSAGRRCQFPPSIGRPPAKRRASGPRRGSLDGPWMKRGSVPAAFRSRFRPGKPSRPARCLPSYRTLRAQP